MERPFGRHLRGRAKKPAAREDGLKTAYFCPVKQPIQTYSLANGLRGVHVPSDSEVVHTAVLIRAGTRDEPETAEGLAHFIEHTLFKGTRSRSMMSILNCLDAFGGELNAYTTKEETCLYASVPQKYFRRAAGLLSDIAQHASFPAREVEKEKEVVIEEIQMYLDTPSEQVFDDFESAVFKGHPLGRNILGSISGVRAMKKQQLHDFIRAHYRGPSMVFCTSGNFPVEEARKTAEEYFSGLSSSEADTARRKPHRLRVSDTEVARDTHQSHFITGAAAYGARHPRRTALALLTNLLGGPAMNSRLHLSIREKNGLAYSVEAGYSVYSDSGLFHIYTGADKQNVARCSGIISRELKKLRDKKLGSAALHAAKRQLKGQLSLSRENRLNVMLAAGKNILVHNRVISPAEIDREIDALTGSLLLETANEIFDPKGMSRLIYLPG